MITHVTKSLFIGEYSDIVGQTPEETSSRLEQIEALGIRYVLSLLSEEIEGPQIAKEVEAFKASSQGKNPINILLHHQPVPVDRNLTGHVDPFKLGLQLALDKIDAILCGEPNAKILIHCMGGIDRTPFVAATFLVRHCGYRNLTDAYRQIKKTRPFVVEHPEWILWPQN